MEMFGSTLLRSFCLSPYMQGERVIIQKLHECRKTNAGEIIGLGHTRKCYLQIRYLSTVLSKYIYILYIYMMIF